MIYSEIFWTVVCATVAGQLVCFGIGAAIVTVVGEYKKRKFILHIKGEWPITGGAAPAFTEEFISKEEMEKGAYSHQGSVHQPGGPEYSNRDQVEQAIKNAERGIKEAREVLERTAAPPKTQTPPPGPEQAHP